MSTMMLEMMSICWDSQIQAEKTFMIVGNDLERDFTP